MSYPPYSQNPAVPQPAAHAVASDRATFLAKVYSLLFTGVMAFFAAAILPVLGLLTGNALATAVVQLAVSLPWWAYFILFLGGAWAAHSVSLVRGLNLVAFYAFALLMGFLSIALVVFAINVTGSGAGGLQGGLVVLAQAAGLTTLVFGGLTAYTLISKKDFGFLGGFLFTGLILLIGGAILAAIMTMLFGMDLNVIHIALSMFSVLLFSGYVLYDTSNILHRYSTDMVVAAALALLVDFVIMFRNILFLLSSLSRD